MSIFVFVFTISIVYSVSFTFVAILLSTYICFSSNGSGSLTMFTTYCLIVPDIDLTFTNIVFVFSVPISTMSVFVPTVQLLSLILTFAYLYSGTALRFTLVDDFGT